MDIIYWDHYYNIILLFNLIIIVALFASLRLFSGAIAHINPSVELFKKDNPAFGISLAGASLAVAIMLSGTIYGSPENDAWYSIESVGIFGVIGITLMALTRLIFEKITLPEISMRNEIRTGNIAVAIADAANVIAAAIIIQAILAWVTINTWQGVLSLMGGYAVSQLLLTGMTLLRIRVFGIIDKGYCHQEQLRNGNVAMALSFAGRKIGSAFAIATAARIVVYEVYDIGPILLAWFFASIVTVLVWKALCFLSERAILFGVDLTDELIVQRNVAVGLLVGVIDISLGFLVSSL